MRQIRARQPGRSRRRLAVLIIAAAVVVLLLLLIVSVATADPACVVHHAHLRSPT